MPENHSRIGKPVRKISLEKTHDKYRKHNPLTAEEISPGIPILKATDYGNIVEKDVTHSRVKCPECEIGATYDEDSEPVCPECGIICAGNGEIIEPIIIDSKAAGRVESEG
jgi:hypothetical protein